MSMSAVQEFLTKVSEDQALQEQIAKAMESDNDRQAVTDLARSKGFDFTAAELGQEIQNRADTARQQAESGELSEDELESVAGGATPALIPLSIATVNAASIIGSALTPKIKW
jgi:predicted ribosomally synthesized peptide with nif11-like leader